MSHAPNVELDSSTPTILVVDDVKAMQEVLKEMIMLTGYHAIVASDGETALDMALKHRPNLILLDIMLPGLNGFEVMEALQSKHETAHIPVILLTGMDDIETKIKGFNYGAVDYITKPFHIIEVQARLRLHIKLSSTTRALINAQKEKFKQIQTAQQSLLTLPKDLPEAKFDVYIQQLQEAGGDFYDVIKINHDTTGYFVADVSGHDIRSGFITPAIKALLKQNCTASYTPAESMQMINEVLCDILPAGKYLTAAWLVINRLNHQASLISMAHPNVIIKRVHGEMLTMEAAGDILGAFPDVIFKEQQFSVSQGDRIYLYTDGLIEGTGIADLWMNGVETIEKLVREIPAGKTTQQDIDWLLNRLEINGKVLSDDVLLMCVEV